MYSTIRPEVELSLTRALTILVNEVKALEDTELDVKAYDNPAWAFKQAYKNGYKKAIRVVTQILDQENKNEQSTRGVRTSDGGSEQGLLERVGGRQQEVQGRTSLS
jgi:hypothetical protein